MPLSTITLLYRSSHKVPLRLCARLNQRVNRCDKVFMNSLKSVHPVGKARMNLARPSHILRRPRPFKLCRTVATKPALLVQPIRLSSSS